MFMSNDDFLFGPGQIPAPVQPALFAHAVRVLKRASGAVVVLTVYFWVGVFTSNAACTSCTTFGAGTVSGTASPESLTEASGIAASRRNAGVLWTHNDGSRERIYALSTNGTLLANFDLNENVDDIEDIAVGPGPEAGVSYLYVGDIGGNVGANTTRADVQVVRIAEPVVELAWAGDARSENFDDVDSFTLTYPDGSYDAEALLVDSLTGDVFVITKQDGSARIYSASLNGLENEAVVALTFVRAISFDRVSGGDISPDGSQIALRQEEAAFVWSRCDNEPVGTALSRSGQNIPIIGPPDELNGEGFAFLSDGTGYVTISEGEDPSLYFFPSLCPVAPRFTLTPSDESIFTGGSVAFHALAVGYPAPAYQWRFQGQVLSGQTSPSLVLASVTPAQAGQYEVLASNDNGSSSATATLTVRAKPDLRITEVQSSTAPSEGLETADWWELTSFESQPVGLTGWRFNDNAGELTDPFVFGPGLVINPGESIVFVEDLSAAEFRTWWGEANVPASVQIVTYDASGLSFGAGGDGIRLWNDTTANANDLVASVDFGAADNGITFNYDPVTGQFGTRSQLGVNGVFSAALSPNDIGSPGRILAPAASPTLRIALSGDRIRIEFEIAIGRRYYLEVLDDLTSGVWTPTADMFQATSNGVGSFEKSISASHRFFRVSVE
jgi:hypothetical protein